jgi:poly(hydroxyalkanoate) depolymerase family esterase
MTKGLSKIWLRSIKRLVSAQAQYLRAATKKQRRSRTGSAAKAATPPKAVAAKRREASESRVRPRAAAWAKGSWTRSFHSAPPLPGRLVNHLSYGLYRPPVKSTLKMPLVVMLHGCKQTIDEFAAGTRMNLLADAQGFAVVYPEQSSHAHAHRCWHWYDDRDTAGRGEARAVVSLVDALIDRYGFDAERIYAVGLSAGGGLASLLALHWPDRFAAVALHSAPALGEAHSGMTAMDVMRRGARHDPLALAAGAIDPATYPGMPAIIVQGEGDAVVAPRNAEQLTAQFLYLNGLVDAQGAPKVGTSRETSSADALIRDFTARGRRVVRSCLIPGLGHAWAGGDEAIPFHSRKGPNASALIWEFLRYQQRQRDRTPVRRREAAAGR